MSADNAYVVFEDEDGWHATHAFMTPLGEDCQYLKYLKEIKDLVSYPNENEAALAAYQMLKEDDMVEYGIISYGRVPSVPCGECLACRAARIVAFACGE